MSVESDMSKICPLNLNQVLCPDLESQEALWMPDELETCAFASLGELKLVS